MIAPLSTHKCSQFSACFPGGCWYNTKTFKIELFWEVTIVLNAAQVYTYTRRILDAYAAVMQPLSAELDMAQNAVDILLFLANNPGLDTARDICTYRKLKPGIVSFHVDNLVREGYLLRTRDPGDRRRCRLVCTDKAAPIIARGQALQEQFVAQMSTGLAPDALETFQHCLTAFAQNLDRMANREES